MRRLLASIAALAPAAVQAQELPPIPRVLLNTAALVCVKVDAEGRVDAFLLDSKGDAARDRAVLAWVRELRWPAAQPGEEGVRNRWFPMPVQFGDVPAPQIPQSCAPGAGRI
ncbi:MULTISPECIES: energy transducer TonB [Sphingomonas]|uniref:TonB family protein n=1 Tax=Sphingomonas leidyi TaxID=68569 RepID=A0A7X5V1Q4_9SPHN|nr:MULTISPECIES: energy transducer TonB [Sphingomonas]MBN8810985.1 energy transducer TonB [Sphingomonas sp.]NIJ66288.1 TonB family protein [Sphingomonas leidyi]OJY54490.1 MAG: hypothetical protein BGP17_05465 [Sphingomonas sp. 67-41]